MSMTDKQKIIQVAELLRSAKSILFITGAGVSADSGLPTYRGIGGIYNDTETDEGIPIEMALAGEMLEQRPEVTWTYLSQIEERCREASFNRAHEIIAEIELRFHRVWILTQNIDGFHSAAGSKNIIDIHGDMHKLLCQRCGWRTTLKDYSDLTIPPECHECGHIVRPDVVFFGELLPVQKIQMLQKELVMGFDLYFSIGTTSVFPYIQQPVFHARSLGKPTVEINPGITEISDVVDIKISTGADDALSRIWEEYNRALSS